MTTPTGVPITLCKVCGIEHPVTLGHCRSCGKPTRFLTPEGDCLRCRREP